MEVFIVIQFLIIYSVVRYLITDHETASEKDFKKFKKDLRLMCDLPKENLIKYFDYQIEKYPKSAVAYLFRGKCHFECGDVFASLNDTTVALCFDNTLAECYLIRAKIYLSLGEKIQAAREYDKAVWFSHQKNPEILRERGVFLHSQGQRDEAQKDLQKATELGDEEANFFMKVHSYNFLSAD